MSGDARSLLKRCLAAVLSTALASAHAQSEPATAWTETQGLLNASRVWVLPERAEGLRTGPMQALDVRVGWTAGVEHEDGTTQAEREMLLDATALALMSLGAQPWAGSVPDETRAHYRIEARITEVWRPHRLMNVVLAVLPWPLAPLFSQGGAATEMALIDTADSRRPIARFECRRYAGVLQFYNAFWRVAHTRAALTDCAREFHAALRRPPGVPGAAFPASAPTRGPLESLAVVGGSTY